MLLIKLMFFEFKRVIAWIQGELSYLVGFGLQTEKGALL